MSRQTGPFHRTIFETIDSTNTEAQRQWRLGSAKTPHWFVALQQTAGVGRRGKRWDSPLGNFSGSVLFVPMVAVNDWPKFTFVASLALWDTLAEVLGAPDEISLKWPNDVLLAGRKVAGILLETVGGNQPEALIVGMGVNLAKLPEDTYLAENALHPTSIFDHAGLAITPQDFLEILGSCFAIRLQRFDTIGWEPTKIEWQQKCTIIGKAVSVARAPAADIQGRVLGIDGDGALLLRTEQGTERILAGDIKVTER